MENTEKIQRFVIDRQIEADVPAAEGSKSVVVRFPSNEEWNERSVARLTQIIDKGRGEYETTIQNKESSDLALFGKIRIEGAELDEYEASLVIENIAKCDISDIDRLGNTFEVKLRVHGVETTHVLNVPSLKQLTKAREQASRTGTKHNITRVKINMLPIGALYDSIVSEVTGYEFAGRPATVEEVPLIHKYKVIDAVQGEMNNIVKYERTGDELF